MTYLLIILTAMIAALQIDNLKANPINKKAWITLGFLIIATIITSFIECNRTYQEKQDKIKSDSLADLRVAKSNKLILTGIGEAIGKYKLGYDSTTKEISALKQLIKDSANRKTTIIEGEAPTLKFVINKGLAFIAMRNDSLLYTISIRSYTASSILKNGTIYILCSSNQSENIFNDLLYVGASPLLTKGLSFAKEEAQTGHLHLVGKNVNNVKTIVVLVRINFTDSHGKNMPTIEEIGILDIINNQFSMMAAPYDSKVIDILKKKKYLNKGAFKLKSS